VAASAGSRLRPGTQVTGDCSRWCGACELCERDRNLCRRIEKFGITTDGFAVRRRTVPERYLYADPHGLPADVLALCEIFAVALRGVGRALGSAAAPPREALVVGGGALGIAVALLLRYHLELPAVWVLERDPGKLDLLRRRFSRLRWLEDAAEPRRESATYADLHRLARFPVVFECSGSASGLERALLLAGMGATVVDLGLGAARGVDSRLVVTKGLSLLGSIGGTGAFPAAMGFLARHRDVAARLITHRFEAEEAAAAFLCGAQEPGRLKVQLRFGEGGG
jgi:L-iditol 2-dehydrogenase